MTSAGALNKRQADKKKAQWRKVCCSEPWVEVVVPENPDGKSWRYCPMEYPPDGDDTGMWVCSKCERICPPPVVPLYRLRPRRANGPQSSPCYDCETDIFEEKFRKRHKGVGGKSLDELKRQCNYPPSALRYGNLMRGDTSELQSLESGKEPDADSGSEFFSDDTKDPGPRTSSIARGRLLVAKEIALRRFGFNPETDKTDKQDPTQRAPRKERGRAAGCWELLLPEPEDEKGFQREFDEINERLPRYWGDVYQLLRSVRRINNPLKKSAREPEDSAFWGNILKDPQAKQEVQEFEACRKERYQLQVEFLKQTRGDQEADLLTVRQLHERIIKLLRLCMHHSKDWSDDVLEKVAEEERAHISKQ